MPWTACHGLLFSPLLGEECGKDRQFKTESEKQAVWEDLVYPLEEESVEKLSTEKAPQEMTEIPEELLKTGTKIKLTLKGIGYYAGETSVTFRIIADNKNLSKAVIKVDDQYYTGKEIEPHGTDEKKDDRAVKVSINAYKT